MRIWLAASFAVALGAAAFAAPARLVPSADGTPDFSGYWTRIGNLWFDPILDDGEGKPVVRLEVDSPNADEIYAGDYNNPVLQPWARDIVKKNAEAEIRLEHVYTADDSCWPSGVPQAANLIGTVQFLQTKDHVLIVYERDHQVRRVWLNRPHSANPVPAWYGESVGHYENGDTLVIDTIALKPHRMSVVDSFGTPHTDKLHVVERYRLYPTPFGKRIEVVVRVDDPGTFTQPWKGQVEYQQDRGVTGLDEIICAENNRDFADGTTFGTIPEENRPQF